MKQAVLVATFLPGVAFCVAGVMELRSGGGPFHKLARLVPIGLGLVAFALFFDPQGVLGVGPDASVTLSRVMTIVSSAIACSGVFLPYSRRATGLWMASGGLTLAVFWMFNRVLA